MGRHHAAAGVLAATLAMAAVAQVPGGLRPSFDVTSKDFPASGTLLQRNMAAERDCGGQNISPAIEWHGEPNDTRSFAVIFFDADGNNGQGEAKWVAYNIQPTVHALATGAMSGATPGMTVGLNDHGKQEYYGPCAPYGRFHYYHFGVYALDIPAGELAAGMSREKLLKAIYGRVRAIQGIEFTYQRTPPPGWTPEQGAPPRPVAK